MEKKKQILYAEEFKTSCVATPKEGERNPTLKVWAMQSDFLPNSTTWKGEKGATLQWRIPTVPTSAK